MNAGDYKRAHLRVKQLYNQGKTEIGYHAQARMTERKIDINDVTNVIRYGQIVEHSKPGEYWRYTIRGKAVDGETMKCVVEINGSLKIVTVI